MPGFVAEPSLNNTVIKYIFPENGAFRRLDWFDLSWILFVPVWIFMLISIALYRKKTNEVFAEILRTQLDIGVELERDSEADVGPAPGSDEKAQQAQNAHSMSKEERPAGTRCSNRNKPSILVDKKKISDNLAAKLAEVHKNKRKRQRENAEHSTDPITGRKASAEGKKGVGESGRRRHPKIEKSLIQDILSSRKPRAKKGHREDELQMMEKALMDDDDSDEDEQSQKKAKTPATVPANASAKRKPRRGGAMRTKDSERDQKTVNDEERKKKRAASSKERDPRENRHGDEKYSAPVTSKSKEARINIIDHKHPTIPAMANKSAEKINKKQDSQINSVKSVKSAKPIDMMRAEKGEKQPAEQIATPAATPPPTPRVDKGNVTSKERKHNASEKEKRESVGEVSTEAPTSYGNPMSMTGVVPSNAAQKQQEQHTKPPSPPNQAPATQIIAVTQIQPQTVARNKDLVTPTVAKEQKTGADEDENEEKKEE